MPEAGVYTLPSEFLQRQVQVHLAGCGGTGSQVLSGLARVDRAWRALGHPSGLEVTAWDPDRVTEANIGRQLFSSADLGAFKSDLLITRLNCFYGLDWNSCPREFNPHGKRPDAGLAPIDLLITCVDSAKARRQIHSLCTQHRRGSNNTPFLWLDTGNTADSGQVVLGHMVDLLGAVLKREGVQLPNVLEVFPELNNSRRKEDNRPSCSLAEALDQQDLFINQAVATAALQLLWTLLRKGRITSHGSFINLATGQTNPLPVPVPPKPEAPAKTPRRGRTRRTEEGV